jgi:SSS family solute:Na+ symporter
MGISWGALAGAFLAPFMLALYWKGVTKAGVWACFASGVGITVVNMFVPLFKSSINAGAFAMLIGFVVVIVVSLLTPKLDKGKVEETFSCYNK